MTNEKDMPDWPPRRSAVGTPDGERAYGSTGQLFEAKNGRWVRKRETPRHFVSMYTDGPSTRWNVIDRHTQEWVRGFPTEEEAREYAAKLNEARPRS